MQQVKGIIRLIHKKYNIIKLTYILNYNIIFNIILNNILY